MIRMRAGRWSYKERKLSIIIGAALLAGSFSPVEAAVQTEPLVVTEKDKVIDDDFNVIGHEYPAAIYVDPTSTGTVQVNSNTIRVENAGQKKENIKDIGIIDTGYGWNGTLNLKDGAQVSGKFTGPDVNTKGILLNGFGYFTKADDIGTPYAGTANLGNNVSVDISADQVTDHASLRGIEVDGENLQAGNVLSVVASAHTGGWTEVQGLQVVHYGTAQLGDHAVIRTSNQINQDSNHSLTDGIITIHNFSNEKVDEPAKGRQSLSIGKEAAIVTGAHNDQSYVIQDGAGEVDGVRLSHTDFTLGDGAQIETTATGAIPNAFGIYTDYHTRAVIGDDLTNMVTAQGKVPFAIGIEVKNNKNKGEVDENLTSTLTIGNRGKTVVSSKGDENTYTRGMDIEGAQVYLKDDNTLQVFGDNTHTHGNAAYTEGVNLLEAGYLEAGNGLQMSVNAVNDTFAYGFEQDHSSIIVGNHFTSTLLSSDTNETNGARSINSQLTIGEDSLNEVQAKGEAPYFWITGYDSEGKTADGSLNLKLGNGSHTCVSYEGNTTHQLNLYGIYNYDALSQIGDAASISVSAPALSNSYVAGLTNNNGRVITGKNTQIRVQAPGGKRSYGIYNTYGTTELGNGASVQLNTSATQNAAVFSAARGNVIFDGGLRVQTGADQDALSAKANGVITALGTGTKQIYGNLLTEGGGAIDLNLNTADSLLQGKSVVNRANDLSGNLEKGITNLTLSDGARWDMTGDSQVTNLTHKDGAVIDMQYNPSYQRLDVENYQGQGGLFRMKTDLDSQQDGDKIYMDSAAAGSSAQIVVQDRSFLLNQEVTGNKHLLLVTDNSKQAKFTGKSLNEGGLWDVTPTIENGSYVRDVMGDANAKDTEWYLTKLTKSVNQDTVPLLKSADNGYALYRNSLDTLRQRLGELRFWQKAPQTQKDDNSGIWARNTYGAYAGDGIDSRENRFQLGFDHWSDCKTVYGVLGERGIASPDYAHGSGKNHSAAGAVYGTWLGDNGSYTDVVAKVGRDDVHLQTFGEYSDKADYRTWERSFSAEYGRTHTLNAQGLFFEPQAQLVFGHLDGEDYTTSRGKTVHMDSFNSRIGRLGFVFGQRRPENSHPFDYYMKASVLHEFGGDRDFFLTAPDGETMTAAGHYRDTWYEFGFGGTYHLNDRTYLYADADRMYGSTWNQKWRWNVGMQWAF